MRATDTLVVAVMFTAFAAVATLAMVDTWDIAPSALGHVASVIVIAASWLFAAKVWSDYLDDLRTQQDK